jgi:hypothetical protein
MSVGMDDVIRCVIRYSVTAPACVAIEDATFHHGPLSNINSKLISYTFTFESESATNNIQSSDMLYKFGF